MTNTPPPPQPEFLKVNGHTLAVKAYNHNAIPTHAEMPIICIHGISSTLDFWHIGQTPAIQARRWYSLSLPGHAPATFPAGFRPDDLTAELITQTLVEGIRQLLGDRPFIVIGHSTGGFAALAVAAMMPEQVKGVVSVSGFAVGKWTGALGLLQQTSRYPLLGEIMMQANISTFALAYPVFRLAFRGYVGNVRDLYAQPNFEPIAHLLQSQIHQVSAAAMICYFRRMPQIDISAWLPRITAPTLVIVGDRDPIVPPSQATLITQAIQRSELVTLNGVGHLPMWEQPEPYHAAITNWLNQHG